MHIHGKSPHCSEHLNSRHGLCMQICYPFTVPPAAVLLLSTAVAISCIRAPHACSAAKSRAATHDPRLVIGICGLPFPDVALYTHSSLRDACTYSSS